MSKWLPTNLWLIWSAYASNLESCLPNFEHQRNFYEWNSSSFMIFPLIESAHFKVTECIFKVGLLWNLTGFIFFCNEELGTYLILFACLSKNVPWVGCTVKSQEMYSKKSRRSYFLPFGIWVIVLWHSNLFSMLPCSSISFWPFIRAYFEI